MRRLAALIAILFALAPSAALAQGVILQAGPATQGHVPCYANPSQIGSQAVVLDCGPPGATSSLTIGTTPIVGGTVGDCLTIGATNVLGQAICGGGGGGGGASITRAQIPTTNLSGTTTFVANGYRTPNDLGNGCVYSSAGATSNGWGAIRSLDNILFNLTFPSGTANVGCFGAYADDGSHTITTGDISANTQWRGTYTAGTTWDTVANQEGKYAAYAGGSTPGSIVWNIGTGNLMFYVPNGIYGINQQILSVEFGFIDFYAGKGQAVWDWLGPTTTIMWLCDSCAYGETFNVSVSANNNGADWGTQVPLVSLDADGAHGGLATQQVTNYDSWCSVFLNEQCFEVSRHGGGAQGDTVKWVNPTWLGTFSDAAYILGGDNTLNNTIEGGDIQGFTNSGIRNLAGSLSTYNLHFENQNFDTFHNLPLTQVTMGGADVDMPGGVSTEISAIHGARSEGDILFQNAGGSPTDIFSSETANADAADWGSAAAYMPGYLLFPGTNNSLKRFFVLVDAGGSEAWKHITSTSGETLTDSTAAYTTNQWNGFSMHWRFGSNGFTFQCTVTANTATTVTVGAGCNGSGLPNPPSSSSLYLIAGHTGNSEPNWDGATGGHHVAVGSGQGFFTHAGSNLVGVGSDASSISVNDYIFIPQADQVNPGGVGVTGGAIMPFPLLAKVTAKSGSNCAWGTNIGGNCLTVSRNAAYSTGTPSGNGGPGYYGTPIADGDFEWLQTPFYIVSGMRSFHGFAGNGVIGPTAGISSNAINTFSPDSGPHPVFTGSCTGTSPVGGATAGTFTAGTCSGGTYILTFALIAPNGWACDAQDQTTPADTVKQTGFSQTSATFTATTVASDVVQFKCAAY